jgi:electron transport complex protein RnfE
MSDARLGQTLTVADLPWDIRALLTLCPLLAVTETAIGALALGLAMLTAVTISRILMLTDGRFIAREVRLIATLLVISGVLAALGLAVRAWLPSLTTTYGVFLALVASNVVVLEMIEDAETPPLASLRQALRTSTGIAVTLLGLGIAREIVGRGSLFSGADRLFGDASARFELALFRLDMGFLLALLPPGAFIATGVLIAAGNILRERVLHRSN